MTHSSSPETVAAGIEACEAELDELAEPFSFVSSRPHYEAAIRCTLAYAFWRVQDFDECRAELQQIEDLIPRIARESAAVATRFEARLATLKELQGLYFEDEESVASEAEQADTLAAAADTEMTEITDTFPASSESPIDPACCSLLRCFDILNAAADAGAKVAHECANAIPTILQPLPAVTSRTPSPLRRKAEAPPTVTPPRSPAGSSFLSITGTPASASAEKRRRVSLPEVEQIAFESDQLLAFERLERCARFLLSRACHPEEDSDCHRHQPTQDAGRLGASEEDCPYRRESESWCWRGQFGLAPPDPSRTKCRC